MEDGRHMPRLTGPCIATHAHSSCKSRASGSYVYRGQGRRGNFHCVDVTGFPLHAVWRRLGNIEPRDAGLGPRRSNSQPEVRTSCFPSPPSPQPASSEHTTSTARIALVSFATLSREGFPAMASMFTSQRTGCIARGKVFRGLDSGESPPQEV